MENIWKYLVNNTVINTFRISQNIQSFLNVETVIYNIFEYCQSLVKYNDKRLFRGERKYTSKLTIMRELHFYIRSFTRNAKGCTSEIFRHEQFLLTALKYCFAFLLENA